MTDQDRLRTDAPDLGFQHAVETQETSETDPGGRTRASSVALKAMCEGAPRGFTEYADLAVTELGHEGAARALGCD